MGIARRVIRQAVFVIVPLTLLSLLVEWDREGLRFVRLFGRPDFVPVSIMIGALAGILNLHGLAWSLERLLGGRKAGTRILFVSMFRLFLFFALITVLVAMKLVNLFGFLIGITVVFVIMVKEGLKAAKEQTGNGSHPEDK